MTAVSGHRAVRTSSPAAANLSAADLQHHVGQVRARLELLTSRVETVEKAADDPRRSRDLDGMKRDLVRVAALAERGGAVKDHLNKLTRRVDELEGGSRQTNEVAALGGRLSRVVQESEGARDRLERRLETIGGQLDAVLGELAGMNRRLDGLDGRLAAAEGRVEELAASPAPAPARARSRSEAAIDGDDLRRIKGIGPKYAVALRGIGVTSWAQVAAWTDQDIAAAAEALGIKPARIEKAGWVAKAQALLAER